VAPGGVMTRVEILRRRRGRLAATIFALVLCVCLAGAWGSLQHPGARTMIGDVLGRTQTTGPTLRLRYYVVGRRSGDGAVVVQEDKDDGLPSDATEVGTAYLFRPHGVSGVWVGSRVRTEMRIQVADDSGTLTAKEILQVRRTVCDLYRPSAGPAELPWLTTLATGNVTDVRLDPLGVALEVLITLMVAGAVGLGVWRFRVGRELERLDRLELEGASACPKCGYEVRGLAVCPECGVEVREQ
jgi:hypothetical protein